METELIDLREHCFRLRTLLSELDYTRYSLAIDWLQIASGVRQVEMFTAEFDDSIMMCGAAFDYESKRSKPLSELTTRLTIFNFVWGSFESVTRGNNYPPLSRALRKEGYPDSTVNRAIWFLKSSYRPTLQLAFYVQEVERLYKLMENHQNHHRYLDGLTEFKLTDHNGLGLHLVRKLRNDLRMV